VWTVRQAYGSGNAIAILTDGATPLQTIYDDDVQPLLAIALDEITGKIAVSTESGVRIYKPFGQGEGALKVRRPRGSTCSGAEKQEC